MENELRFMREENGSVSIALNYAFHPNWESYDLNNDSEVVLNFLLDDGKLKRVIIEIDGLIKRFPERKFH